MELVQAARNPARMIAAIGSGKAPELLGGFNEFAPGDGTARKSAWY
jgi:hypothetical protein